MATLSVQELTRDGLEATYSDGTALAANTDHVFRNDGRVVLHIKKGTNDANVTIVTPQEIDGLAVADRVVDVSANTEVFIGPFPPTIYNDSTNELTFQISEVTGLEAAALQMK